jgi:hypothetical protein
MLHPRVHISTPLCVEQDADESKKEAGAHSVGKGKGGAGTSNVYMYIAPSLTRQPAPKIFHLRA